MGPASLMILLAACSSSPTETQAGPAAPLPPPPARVKVTSAPWIASGDVTDSSAMIWTHAGDLTRVRVEAWRADDPEERVQWRSGLAEPAAPPAAPTAKLKLIGLPPATDIGYRVLTGDGREAEGRLRTAPAPDRAAAVSLVVAGDLGGQGWCRQPGGTAIFDAISHAGPDLAVFNGDMVYVDNSCPPQAPDGSDNVVLDVDHPTSIHDVAWTDGPALRRALDRWWAYNRADPALQSLLESVSVVAQWDDHEVVNDFGASWTRWETGDPERAGYPTLVDQGRQAFLAWNPIDDGGTGRIHRRFRWGQHVELFVVDARSHRSPNGDPDGPAKTMLGADQLAWLTAGLRDSDATWKVVSVDVPMSVPTGSAAWRAGRDGWASGTGDPTTPAGELDRSTTTGFEHELAQLLAALAHGEVTGVVFVTTDVHHSRILRYDNAGAPVHEVISGPLRAWSGPPVPLDPTFAPVELFAAGEVFSFAYLAIAADGGLAIEIRGEDGVVLPGASLSLPAP